MLPFKSPVAFGFRIKQYLASPPITLIDQALKTMQSLAIMQPYLFPYLGWSAPLKVVRFES